MSKATLNRTVVRDLIALPTVGQKLRVYDDKITGFCVEKSPSGNTTYWFRHTNNRHQRREIRIGRHGDITTDQARKRALELKASISLGGDPSGDRDRRRAVPTYATFVAEHFLPHVQRTIRSHSEYETMMRLRIIPFFGRLRLDEIRVNQVSSFGLELGASGLSNARCNRHLAVLRCSMNFALRQELYVGRNPAQSPHMLREECREVFLTGSQLQALMLALSFDTDRIASSVIALLALTGARKSEILNATWANIDVGRQLLTVPLAKSGRRRHVQLSDAAISVLLAQPRLPRQPYVFPSDRVPGQPLGGVRAVWARAKRAAGVPQSTRLHDLRHTFASLCVGRAVPLYDISKLLGHSNQLTTARYAHLRDDRLLDAANAVGGIAMPAFGTAR